MAWRCSSWAAVSALSPVAGGHGKREGIHREHGRAAGVDVAPPDGKGARRKHAVDEVVVASDGEQRVVGDDGALEPGEGRRLGADRRGEVAFAPGEGSSRSRVSACGLCHQPRAVGFQGPEKMVKGGAHRATLPVHPWSRGNQSASAYWDGADRPRSPSFGGMTSALGLRCRFGVPASIRSAILGGIAELRATRSPTKSEPGVLGQGAEAEA